MMDIESKPDEWAVVDDKKLLHLGAINSGPFPTLLRILGTSPRQKTGMDFNTSTVSHKPAGAKAEVLLNEIVQHATPVNLGWLLLGFVVLSQLYKPRKSVGCNFQCQLGVLANQFFI